MPPVVIGVFAADTMGGSGVSGTSSDDSIEDDVKAAVGVWGGCKSRHERSSTTGFLLEHAEPI